ncbi:ATP-binding cassette domain-containing protein [Marinobacteraceae bacterium S3BR75-40.1]
MLTLTDFAVPPLAAFSGLVSAGDCIVLSGPSGTGKSRFLYALVDLIPHQGRATLWDTGADAMAPAQWRRQVMLVPQEPAWWEAAVAAHFPVQPGDDDLQAVGLAPAVMSQPVQELSTGQRQRLGILRALALTPSVLLLDEPTAHLDAASAGQVEALIQRFLQETGKAVIWVSHDPAQARRVGNAFWQIRDGRIETGQTLEAG